MAGPIVKFQRLTARFHKIEDLVERVEELQKSVGHIAAELHRMGDGRRQSIQEHEFRVFSQWGEDGIIQYLIHQIEIPRKIFVEFGVEDYRVSNTRFLLQHDNWSGLIMDGSASDIAKVKKEPIYLRNDIRAVCAFIDRENINDLLRSHGIVGDIGLLSIDIDGNDYWVWEAISCIAPRIVICEYESLFGDNRAVTTPYDKNFVRLSAHYSFLYGGASIGALSRLGAAKGYSLVGSNSAGNNVFFVRTDVLGNLKPITAQQAYVKGRFRNSRDEQGNLTYLSFEENLKVIEGMPLFDLEKNALITVGDIIENK